MSYYCVCLKCHDLTRLILTLQVERDRATHRTSVCTRSYYLYSLFTFIFLYFVFPLYFWLFRLRRACTHRARHSFPFFIIILTAPPASACVCMLTYTCFFCLFDEHLHACRCVVCASYGRLSLSRVIHVLHDLFCKCRRELLSIFLALSLLLNALFYSAAMLAWQKRFYIFARVS